MIELVHSDHPTRHWDRTCPACINDRGVIMDREFEAKDWWEANKERFPNVKAEDAIAIYAAGYEDGYEWGVTACSD